MNRSIVQDSVGNQRVQYVFSNGSFGCETFVLFEFRSSGSHNSSSGPILMGPLTDPELGLTVPPYRVRLQPSAEDGYAWSVSDAQIHLLRTPLGRGTIGLYQEIIGELGKSIEAVRPQPLQRTPRSSEASSACQDRPESFTEVIQRVESENERLIGQVEQYREQSESLLRKEQDWQAKIADLQAEVVSCQQVIQKLQEDVSNSQTSILDAIAVLKSNPNLLEK
ncbi:hypothetical protein N7470_000559 [Penicillium chermesinum]|nr:hypothetical protein N7470_000559 [Penicillium chermesinum]